MFWGFFFLFFFKHKYQEILLTERKYTAHQSCKGAFSRLFTHTGQLEEMESVTSPTAHSYFSTLWHFYTQLNHQMCLFFLKQWHRLRKSSWIHDLLYKEGQSAYQITFWVPPLLSTHASVSCNCCIFDDERSLAGDWISLQNRSDDSNTHSSQHCSAVKTV